MKKEIYLGMRQGDLDGKPYSRFWNPDMAPLPEHACQAILHGPEAPELGLNLAEADQLMQPGYLALETGTTVLPNGQILVAVRTEMPRVTGAMFEWWMGWHHMENQRYKLWHPRARVANGTLEKRGDDPQLSDKDKYMTTHYVTEYIGDKLHEIAIQFVEPDTFLKKTTNFSENGVTAIVCAKVELQSAPIIIGYLIYQIRAVAGGSEMRSRFWLGKPEFRNAEPESLRNRVLGSKPIRGLLSTPGMAHEMLVHCAMEMNHLASFLPDLYAEYCSDN